MEKSGEPYCQFQDETPTNTLSRSSPPPMYSPPQHNYSVDQQVAKNCRRTKRLATVGMVISCLLLLFGIVSIVLGNIGDIWNPSVNPGTMSSSIWAPVLGIITSGLGLGALRYGNYSRSCLLIAHFVMCIISALASGILVIFTCICIADTSNWLGYYKSYLYYDHTPIGLPEALMAFQVFILIGALANMIGNIVSSAFICKYWCGRKIGAQSTVVYIPSQVATGNGQMQAISLPPGAQVIFLPPNNQENNVPVQTNP